jgi:hypothetical protein
MVKIRNANKSGTLAVSLLAQMKTGGYVQGIVCDWVKSDLGWTLVIRPSEQNAASEPSKAISEVQA